MLTRHKEDSHYLHRELALNKSLQQKYYIKFKLFELDIHILPKKENINSYMSCQLQNLAEFRYLKGVVRKKGTDC